MYTHFNSNDIKKLFHNIFTHYVKLLKITHYLCHDIFILGF